MDRQALTEYLGGKDERRIAKAVKTIRKFEKYLSGTSKSVDQADPEDLERFLEQHTQKSTMKYNLADLELYYAAKDNSRMQEALAGMKYRFTPPFILKKFLDVNPNHITTLEKLGVRTNNQLLNVGNTPEKRAKLSEKTGISLGDIEKLVKLSDLVRIFAVKSTRAKLYYDSGVDTVEKMSRWDPKELRNMLVEFVEKADFPGIATLPSEAEFTVNFAKRLPIVIEFQESIRVSNSSKS